MRKLIIVCVTLASALLAGCAALGGPFCAPYCQANHRSSSSLVDFLYQNGQAPPAANTVPELHVPLRVGLAFLPSRGGAAPGPDEALKEQLLERIRQRFSDRKFVSEIVVIPDYYLAGQRGFDGLAGVQRLYAVDVMALVSYDQVTHADQNDLSLGYITIIGAYVLKGDRYDVSTLVDLAVVDPGTRSLVLRAGGVDTRHGNATMIDASHESRAASSAGFSAASDQMVEHFDHALSDFESQVRAGRANVHVVHRDGSAVSGGAGAFTWPWLVLLVPLVVARCRAQGHRPA